MKSPLLCSVWLGVQHALQFLEHVKRNKTSDQSCASPGLLLHSKCVHVYSYDMPVTMLARMRVCWQGLLPVLQWQQGLHADHGQGAQHAASPGPHSQGRYLPSQ